MSRWGVFESADGTRHVMPSDAEGLVLNGHVMKQDCWCKPNQDDEVDSLYIHNDPERGGFNS